MNDEIRKMIDEEIASQMKGISFQPDGSDEKAKRIKQMTDLYELRMKDELNRAKIREDEERRIAEYGQKAIENLREEKKLKEQKKDRIVKIVTSGAELLIPLAFYGFFMVIGYKFEEKGIYSSATFKDVRKYLRPKK